VTNQMHTPMMSEQDLVNTVLSDEKRTVAEYATAATEASCPVVRECFTQLFHDTLQIHNQVYDMMRQQGWYNPSSESQQRVQQELAEHQQTGQQTQQWIAQQQTVLGSAGAGMIQGASAIQNQQPQQGQPH